MRKIIPEDRELRQNKTVWRSALCRAYNTYTSVDKFALIRIRMKRPSQRFIHKRSLARSLASRDRPGSARIRWIVIYAFGARNRFSMLRLVLPTRIHTSARRRSDPVACANFAPSSAIAADHHRSLALLRPSWIPPRFRSRSDVDTPSLRSTLRHPFLPFRISAHEFPSVFLRLRLERERKGCCTRE